MKSLFGKYILEWKKSINGAPDPSNNWNTVDVPKEGSANLDTAEGTKNELKGDDGKTVDSYTDPGTSTLTFALIKKKNMALPFPDDDGVVSDEYSFRVRSAVDGAAPGFQLDRCTLSARRTWAKNDAYCVEYTATSLEPASGAQCKELGVDVDKLSLEFSASADTTGKEVAIENHNGAVTATKESGATWITDAAVASDNSKVTIKVDANSAATARAATVTLEDATGFKAVIVVNQAASE